MPNYCCGFNNCLLGAYVHSVAAADVRAEPSHVSYDEAIRVILSLSLPISDIIHAGGNLADTVQEKSISINIAP